MHDQDSLTSLFIEDLGRVTGAQSAGMSTQAVGEEGAPPLGGSFSTQAVGEEGAPPLGGGFTTQAVGEEGAPPLGGGGATPGPQDKYLDGSWLAPRK